MAKIDPSIAAMEGMLALPRRNGELVFEAPWQGRAFGIGVALCQRGFYDWKELQASLIESIGTERDQVPSYYEQWLDAIERVLVAKGIVRR